MAQAWREPRSCGECSEFYTGRRALSSGIEAPGWCIQCAGPVRPEAPACPLFDLAGDVGKAVGGHEGRSAGI